MTFAHFFYLENLVAILILVPTTLVVILSSKVASSTVVKGATAPSSLHRIIVTKSIAFIKRGVIEEI